MRTLLLTTAALLALVLDGVPAAGQSNDFVVVVNSANTTQSLTRADLSRLFLKRETRWANGAPAIPVDQPWDAPVRTSFTESMHGRAVAAVVSYWQQQIFSGGEIPPVERANDQAVLEFVRSNANAIGYVRSGTPLGQSVVALSVR